MSKGKTTRNRAAYRDLQRVRDRLVSQTGTAPAFDYELLFIYARNQSGAALVILALALMVCGVLLVWLNWQFVAMWAGAMLLAAAIIGGLAVSFMRADAEAVKLTTWRNRFVVAELFQAVVWGALAILPRGGEESIHALFVFAVFLVMLAVRSMLTHTVMPAVLAATLPITLIIIVASWQEANLEFMAIAGVAVVAQCYFVLLARRMNDAALTMLVYRAEKDLLIAELEEEKSKLETARFRAEDANIAKSRFLATMSHELRTPLNAILGFSEVMKDALFGPHSTPQYAEYASDIHRSGKHLLDLINEILDLSRVEAGRYEMNEEAVTLIHVVEDCVHLVSLRAREKGIEIDESYEQSMPRLWADERAIRQICLNILSNAIKFTPSNGRITVRCGWTSGGGQYISIRDTGPGIPEDELEKVQQPFGQGSLAHKTAEDGAGLGLPIVKGLIDLHGGQFIMRSRLREGTEVTVIFPRDRVMQALPALQSNDALPRRTGT